jgi:hydrogenase maturation protease
MKIICVGNPFLPADSLGPRVYTVLAESELPEGVELIEGGLSGLDLLRFVGDDTLIFVDSLQGFGRPGELIILHQTELADSLPDNPASLRYDHTAGLAYLLRVIPILYPHSQPFWLVGLETKGQPPEAAEIERVAGACLRLLEGEPARC